MEAIRTLRNDIRKSGKQLFDDRKVSDIQIEYWIKIAADRLLSQRIEKQGLDNQGRSGAWLTTFVLPIRENDFNEPNGNRICGKYAILPRSVYDYSNDRGIDYMIAYMDEECDGCPRNYQVQFTRTTPRLLGARWTEYERPRPRYPKFWREQDRLWLEGLNTVPLSIIGKIEVGLLCTLPNILDIDIDEPLDFPAERIDVLRRYVMDMLRTDLSLPGTKVKNDGTEGDATVQQSRSGANSSSVNDQSLNAL